jgi:TrmH RNA methyltransferase
LPAVAAVFAQAPERVERLFFTAERRRDAEPFCAALARLRRPFRQVGADELARVAASTSHGGIVALARPKPVLDLDPAAAVRDAARVKLLVILDGVGNPHNLGAIARTAAFLGLDRLVISDHPGQAGPSAAAHRVAEGGLEYIQLYRAARLPAALKRLKPAYRVIGTALDRGGRLADIRRDRPIALVLGNEEEGLDTATLAACDEVVTIEGAGTVQSLNVAATAAILIYELRRP